MLVQQSALLLSLGEHGETYSDQWCSLGTDDSAQFDRKLRTAGWNFFFMADELRTIVPAWGGHKTLMAGVKRLLARTMTQQFNCMQLSNVLRQHFLGIPYFSVVAHARHLQKGSRIDNFEQRSLKNKATRSK